MGTGNTTEIINDEVQPDEVVETESELIESNPQDEKTEPTELYVEDEGDQEKPKKTNMTQEQSYAAFRKEQDKRKRKNEELEREKKASADLRRELDELKSTVGKMSKGSPPKIADFDYDDDSYQEATKKYYSTPQDEAPTA